MRTMPGLATNAAVARAAIAPATSQAWVATKVGWSLVADERRLKLRRSSMAGGV